MLDWDERCNGEETTPTLQLIKRKVCGGVPPVQCGGYVLAPGMFCAGMQPPEDLPTLSTALWSKLLIIPAPNCSLVNVNLC